MLIDLTGKVAVITGAARGIGRAMADRLVAEGATVIGWDLAWPDSGVGFDHMVVDVTRPESVADAVAAVVAAHERLDIVVNNAGIGLDTVVVDLAESTWRKVIDVNLNGVFNVCKQVAPVMKQQRGGRIINAASFAAIVPSVGSSAYAASKAGVVSLTRVLAGELGPWNVTVNAYAPGMVPSEINHFTQRPPAEQESLLSTLSLRRWETTDDVADLVCFLASDKAGYITGALIDVSGGKLATQRPQLAYDMAGLA
ncbi:MAG: SDR family oxidoreductase [Propionibacteriaceae bacterium]|jgi:3-oxoacyl-[acyl-carrier protein] reductase|nr:SDR family oxidoreductase [Propionibacteriaceae bacterium]